MSTKAAVMLYAILWVVVASLLAVWSLAAWALQSFGVWAVSNADTLGGAAARIGSLELPAWLAPWLSAEALESLKVPMASVASALGGLLGSVPGLADGVGVAVAVLWGVGALLLVAAGAGTHALVAAWRRRAPVRRDEGRPLLAG